MPICYQVKVQTETPEIKTFLGKEHTVIPLIALVEGVFEGVNSGGPEFISDEVLNKTVLSWNGRPVVVDHPQIDGAYVSANNVDVLETELVGQVFNARVEDKKLKMDAWIVNESEGDRGDRIEGTLNKVLEGEVNELSVGFFAEVLNESGTFQGQDYDMEIETILPDHLALLSESTGACSVEAGCGTNRVYTKVESDSKNATEPRVNCSCLGGEGLDKAWQFLRTHTTFSDIEEGLLGLLGQRYPDQWFYICATSADYVIYANYEGLFSLPYTIEANGQIILGEERTRVRPDTNFVPLTSKEFNMNKDELVTELVNSDMTNFEETDKEWLMAQDAAMLDKLLPKQTKEDEEEEEETRSRSLEDLLNETSPEVREAIQHGHKLFTAHRNTMLSAIKANKKCKFSEEELKDMSMDHLEKLANLAEVESFVGKNIPQVYEDAEAIPQAPSVFDRSKNVA